MIDDARPMVGQRSRQMFGGGIMRASKVLVPWAVALAGMSSAERARAQCLQGTTDAQLAFMAALGPLDPDLPDTFVDYMQSPNGVRFVSDNASWNAAGMDDPNNTDLPFNKLAWTYLLLVDGVTGVPTVQPVPLNAGGFELDQFGLGLQKSFHRSDDEWLFLGAKGSYQVCDYLNTTTGLWECSPSSVTVNYFDQAQQRAPASDFLQDNVEAGSWGVGTFSRIVDSATDVTPFADPTKRFTPLWQDGFLGIDQKMLEYWHCAAFENQERTAVDEMAIPRLLHDIASMNWRSVEFAKFGTWSFCGGSFAGNCDGFVNPNLGKGRANLARAIEFGMLPQQVAHRALCDVSEAPENWVPHMVVELTNLFANDAMLAEGVYGNTPFGRSPFVCGVISDILLLTPGVDLCPSGELACETEANCTGAWPAGYACTDGCCVPEPVVK